MKQWRRINHDVEPGIFVFRVDRPCLDIEAIYKNFNNRSKGGPQIPVSRSAIEFAIMRSLWITIEYMTVNKKSVYNLGEFRADADTATEDMSRAVEPCLAILLGSVAGSAPIQYCYFNWIPS